MSQKKSSTKKQGDKSAETRRQLTAERLHDFLTSPDVKENVKRRVKKLVGQLYEAGEWDTLPETPAYFGLLFEQTYINDHLARGTAEPAERDIYGQLAAVVNRHEPKDVHLARRVSELINSGDEGDEEVVEWFMQLTNDVGVALENPAFCSAAFVEAARRVRATKPVRRITAKNVMLHGAQQAYKVLQEIVRRVDAGESLAEIRDERQRAMRECGERHEAEEAAKPEPKDKTSDEWRYWKLRQMEAALTGTDSEEFQAARLEVAELIGTALALLEPGNTSTVISILPSLIAHRQKLGDIKPKALEAEPKLELPTSIPRGRFNRKAVARTLKEARQADTEGDYESQLLAAVLHRQRKLDTATHFNAVSFSAVLYCKIKDMPATARQALFSDPTFARALYPHVKLAFPEEAKGAFSIYFRDLAEHASHILDEIQREADKGGATNE